MNEILLEIREFIKNGYFINEENIRFSLVSRIIQELGWNIWNPKEEIRSGNAKNEAETYLTLSQKQRSMEDAFSEARRQVLEPPFPSLPEAIIAIVEKDGYKVSIDDASRFVKKQGAKKQKPETPKIIKPAQKIVRKPQQTISGSFAGKKVSSFTFNNNTYEARYWIDVLVRISEILYQTHKKDFNEVLSLAGRKRPYYT